MNLQKIIKTAVIVIPTYNEADNVGNLIHKIFEVAKIDGWSIKILIVDGQSTDDTVKIVQEKMKVFDGLSLIVEEKKEGIGAAYLSGFRYVIDNLRADIVFEFDGDFQHPPEMIPIMIKKIDEGCDYIIGSRFSNGGRDMRSGNIVRKALSSFGGYLARFILFFPNRYFFQVKDPTSGLRATRVKGFMDRLNLDTEHLYSKKFGYKIQLLSETIKLRPKYCEVPLLFYDRKKGQSKIEAGTAMEILMSAIKSRCNLS